MSTIASKFSIPAAPTSGSNMALDFMNENLSIDLDTAGWQRMFRVGSTGWIYRMPTLDNYHSQADLFYMETDTTNFIIEEIYDYDMCRPQAPTIRNHVTGSTGGWTGGTWPTTGNPQQAGIHNDGINHIAAAFADGNDAWTIRTIVSEYGLAILAADGTNTTLTYTGRTVDDIQGNREMHFETSASSGYTLTAPSGPVSAHMRVRIEGNDFDITLPTGSSLSNHDIAQSITMQIGGMGEAIIKDKIDGEYIRVRIPQNRMPVGGYSTTKPQIALTYQDDTMETAGLSFALVTGSVTAVTTGADGTIRKASTNWPVLDVRQGATVYNKTRSNSALVTRFSSSVTNYDTMIMDTIPGTWVAGDEYEVYPGPENHAHGIGRHNGIYQGVVSGSETLPLTGGVGNEFTIILNDLYGEAFDHFTNGQTITLTNNGCAAVLDVSSSTGFELGEQVGNTTSGAQGVVRAISGNSIVIDTIRGSLSSSYSTTPWSGSNTVESEGHGTGNTTINTTTDNVITTIKANPPSASNSTGWFTGINIIQKGTVGGGDLRTTLRVNSNNLNSSLIMMPAFMVGTYAKLKFNLDRGGLPTGGEVGVAPNPRLFLAGIAAGIVDADIRRNEVAAAVAVAHDPDAETHSMVLAELGVALRGGGPPGSYAAYSTIPHIKMVTDAGVAPTVGDELYEDGDSNRKWIPVEKHTATNFGAGGDVNDQWFCIGPGGVS